MNREIQDTPNLQSVELLSPAKNLQCGIEAINHGADAVYIGASRFGARAAAGNDLADIEKLIQYAHLFNAKVYVTINTILTDNEIEEAHSLIWNLYNIGTDAIIIQDMGLLELDLPPIALHASTQTDNRSVEKIDFLEKIGFSRVILARELSLQQIANIKQHTQIELEAFVYGSLCVSYSGLCYMSQDACGRSANRGECAQLCRLPYSLEDASGKIIVKDKHLLSLKDMDRSDFIADMLRAGVQSFKIEGRLKESNYVKNITAYYRTKIDAILSSDFPHLKQSSIGKTTYFFSPNPQKSFHRGKTDYLLKGDKNAIYQFDTPKSMGEQIGIVEKVLYNNLLCHTTQEVHNGDGLCFLNNDGIFSGFNVNTVSNHFIFPNQMPKIAIGTTLYRNYDHHFEKQLKGKSAERKIALNILFFEEENGFVLRMSVTNGATAEMHFHDPKQEAVKPENAIASLKTQLAKLGDTIFFAENIDIQTDKPYFFPLSKIGDIRRKVVTQLMEVILKQYVRPASKFHLSCNQYPYPIQSCQSDLSTLNIMNRYAVQFYQKHGITELKPAYELESSDNHVLMYCKHCIKLALGYCTKQKTASPSLQEPLFLVHQGRRYQLEFDCVKCECKIKKQ